VLILSEDFLKFVFVLFFGNVLFEIGNNVLDFSKLLKELLVMRTTLERVSGGDELSHLVKNA
jgi:hypothetical protein